MDKMVILLVATGGAIGSLARYFTGLLVARFWGHPFPLATFSINMVGSFLLGILGAWLVSRGTETNGAADFVRFGLGMGFLSAFTTFSTFELENLRLIEDGRWHIAAAYIIASVFVGLVAVRFGVGLGESLFGTR